MHPYCIGMPSYAFSPGQPNRSYTVQSLGGGGQFLLVCRRGVVLAGLAGLLLLTAGCTSTTRPTGNDPSQPQRVPAVSIQDTGLLGFQTQRITADWDDVDAALDVGLTRGQSAIVSSTRTAKNARFDLVTITGREGWIEFARQSEAAPAAGLAPETITITAHIQGQQGPVLAERLLEATAKRLRQLAGVATAPIEASDLAPEPMHDTR
jgi:hypothetical protein